MGSLSPVHWIIIAGVAVLLFGGRGKLSGAMGDAAKGIRAFRDGMKDAPEETMPALGAPAADKAPTTALEPVTPPGFSPAPS